MNGYRVIGRTVDDAAGEAFDKVAEDARACLSRRTRNRAARAAGMATRFDFPRSMLDSGDHNFSFSGLKTAVRYLLRSCRATVRSSLTCKA